jgi:hypothetical protein
VVGLVLATQGSGALAGEHEGAVGLARLGLAGVEGQVGDEGLAGLVVEVNGAGLAALGADDGDRPGALIEHAVVDAQRGDLADAQPGPVAQREDGGEPARVGPLDQGLEDGALLGGQLGGAEGRDGGPLDGVGGIAGELAGVDRPLTEAGDGGQRAGMGAGLATVGGEVRQVAFQRGNGEQIWAEGAAVGLGGEPGDQAVQGGRGRRRRSWGRGGRGWRRRRATTRGRCHGENTRAWRPPAQARVFCDEFWEGTCPV